MNVAPTLRRCAGRCPLRGLLRLESGKAGPAALTCLKSEMLLPLRPPICSFSHWAKAGMRAYGNSFFY